MRRICVESGCAGITLGMQYVTCEKHGSETRQSRKSRKVKAQGTKSGYWIKLREQALARDGFRCQLALRGCTEFATTVHLDESLGGNHFAARLDDCTSACRHCHGVYDGARTPR